MAQTAAQIAAANKAKANKKITNTNVETIDLLTLTEGKVGFSSKRADNSVLATLGCQERKSPSIPFDFPCGEYTFELNTDSEGNVVFRSEIVKRSKDGVKFLIQMPVANFRVDEVIHENIPIDFVKEVPQPGTTYTCYCFTIPSADGTKLYKKVSIGTPTDVNYEEMEEKFQEVLAAV